MPSKCCTVGRRHPTIGVCWHRCMPILRLPLNPVMSSLSNGNMQKTPFENSLRFSCTPKLLSRPFDKIKMTQGQGQWPRDLRQFGWLSCAKHSEKSVDKDFYTKVLKLFGPCEYQSYGWTPFDIWHMEYRNSVKRHDVMDSDRIDN